MQFRSVNDEFEFKARTSDKISLVLERGVEFKLRPKVVDNVYCHAHLRNRTRLCLANTQQGKHNSKKMKLADDVKCKQIIKNRGQ